MSLEKPLTKFYQKYMLYWDKEQEGSFETGNPSQTGIDVFGHFSYTCETGLCVRQTKIFETLPFVKRKRTTKNRLCFVYVFCKTFVPLADRPQ